MRPSLKINYFLLARFLIAGIFLVSGMEKLLSPIENFIYAIQGFEALHSPGLERLTAEVMPWIEFFVGLFLLLGLWTRIALIGVMAMGFTFALIVGQGIWRGLPLINCGCFGDLIHFPIFATFTIDCFLFSLGGIALLHLPRVTVFSLDVWLRESRAA
ncbi:MAG: DoxX family membrane protein [Candidatus Omnitrophica bacterium]|nr:DoxX family membrane protein [Candidatus Omnitrophota bacterium]